VFVVNEVNGTWGTAIKVPGLAKLNEAEDPLPTQNEEGKIPARED